MPDYRQIHTKIWHDEWFLDLESDRKLLFIYLFSNPRACLAGIYDIPIKVIAFDTGIDLTSIPAMLEDFERQGKAYYDNGVVFIPKLVKYNAGNIKSPKVQANLRSTIDTVKGGKLKAIWVRLYGDLIGYQYRIDTITEVEKEQEQEQEQEHNDGAKSAPAPPSSYPEWLTLLKDSNNKTAALVFMYRTLYTQDGEKSDFGRIGALAKKAGSVSSLASILWMNATKGLASPIDYITKCVNNNKKGNGKASAPIGLDAFDAFAGLLESQPEEEYIDVKYTDA